MRSSNSLGGVNVTRRTVTVFRSKNGWRRTVPVYPTVLTVLTAKATVRSLATDRVFCSRAYTPMESGHLRRSFRLALCKARIEDFQFHDLRHTFATTLVQSGIDLYKVHLSSIGVKPADGSGSMICAFTIFGTLSRRDCNVLESTTKFGRHSLAIARPA